MVFFYLIVQMVGAGELVQLLFGIDYNYAVVSVGVLMIVYVTFGGMVATTWVQIVKASLLLLGAPCSRCLAWSQFGFSFEKMASAAVAVHKDGAGLMGPGKFLDNPISAISFALGAVFGLLGLPHILMRFFTVPNAKEARKSVFYAAGFIGYFFLLICVLGLSSVVIVGTNPEFFVNGKSAAADRRPQHGGAASRQGDRRQPAAGVPLGGGLRDDPGGGLGPCIGRAPRRSRTISTPTSSARAGPPNRTRSA